MPHPTPSEALRSPEYWGGHDISDPSAHIAAPYMRGLYLADKLYKRARLRLQEQVGKVALGDATETVYEHGEAVDSELPDGSLVIIDAESLGKWTYADPKRVWAERSNTSEPETPITRPYSAYWLNNQDLTPHPSTIGSESKTFRKDRIIYTRLLDWGIVVRDDVLNAIQPFSFRTTKLLPDASLRLPALSKDRLFQEHGIALPLTIGEVTVSRRLNLGTYAIDSLSRIRSIAVVQPASPEKDSPHERA